MDIDKNAMVRWEWDFERDGLRDIMENHVVHSKDFKWSCCGEDGSSFGCDLSRHWDINDERGEDGWKNEPANSLIDVGSSLGHLYKKISEDLAQGTTWYSRVSRAGGRF